MKLDVLLGLQWGDEGKGKVVDVLSPHYDIITRFQGGPNAGHTLEFNKIKHVLHTIPSGIFRNDKINIIGNGVVIDPVIFKKEIEGVQKLGINLFNNLFISKKAHLILPSHRILDAASETNKGKLKIGSTLKGIGPTYMDKTGRNGLRVGDINNQFKEKYETLVQKHTKMLNKFYEFDYNIADYETEWFEGIKLLRKFKLIDSEQYLNQALNSKKMILAEGAQGSLLDIDFGSYPYVTSSNTVCAGACTGLGIAPNKIGKVIGIFKAYCTRVGMGPFPTELFDEDGQNLRDNGNEYGSTTGRPRRCGWLDLVALKYSIMINGVTELCMMKSDVMDQFDEIKICTAYKLNAEEINHMPYEINENIEAVYTKFKGWKTNMTSMTQAGQFPEEFKNYVNFIEKETGIPIKIVSVGPNRSQTIKI